MRTLPPLVLLAAGGGLCLPLLAQQPYTERVSLNSGELEANAASEEPAFSGDARYVAFASAADNLVSNDFNGLRDVFLRARHADRTLRLSVSSNGTEANGESFDPALSASGQFVAYTSTASNLVSNDGNGVADVFVRDVFSSLTERVSVGALGLEANGASSAPAITADGRYVFFVSEASNLVAGDGNGVADVFVHDRWTASTERLSVHSSGAEANGASSQPTLSYDGRFALFTSAASNLVANDTNGATDVFLRDRMTDLTERVSLSFSGAQGNGDSFDPATSTDGFTLAFASVATNLVPNDGNGVADVFVRNRHNQTTVRVSVDSSGAEASGASRRPALIPSGVIVAFDSIAPDLVAGDSNAASDVFIHIFSGAVTERISVRSGGGEANGPSSSPACAVDARVITFLSAADNLVLNDTNGVHDAFVRNRGLGGAGTSSTLVLAAEPQWEVGESVIYTLFSMGPGNSWYLLGSLGNAGSTIGGHAFQVGPSVRVLAQGQADNFGTGYWAAPPLPPSVQGRTLFVQAAAISDIFAIHDSNMLERFVE